MLSGYYLGGYFNKQFLSNPGGSARDSESGVAWECDPIFDLSLGWASPQSLILLSIWPYVIILTVQPPIILIQDIRNSYSKRPCTCNTWFSTKSIRMDIWAFKIANVRTDSRFLVSETTCRLELYHVNNLDRGRLACNHVLNTSMYRGILLFSPPFDLIKCHYHSSALEVLL